MKKLYYFILFLTTTLILNSCWETGGIITVKGKFNHIKQGQFFIYSSSPDWDSYDTILVNNGEFEYSHLSSDTLILYIQYPNYSQTICIGIPGKTTTLKGDANNLREIKIGGNKENEMLSQFYSETNKLDISNKRKKAKQFIKEQPASFASLALFQQYFLNTETLNLDEINSLLQLLYKAAPYRIQIQTLRNQLNPLIKCRPGNLLPKFKTTTVKGDTISNETFKGKWIIINFWSSWGRDFFYPMAEANKAAKHFKGKLETLNICLDADTFDCMNEVRRDSIKGYTVCDGKIWNSPLVSAFGIRYMPSNIFVDNKGKVVARDLKTDNFYEEFRKNINH